MQGTLVYDSDGTEIGAGHALRNHPLVDQVYVAWEQKVVSTGVSTLRVTGWTCSAAFCDPPTAVTGFGGGLVVGGALRGGTEFTHPSMSIKGPPAAPELRITRRERWLPLTTDCDEDGVLYATETAGLDITQLELSQYPITTSGVGTGQLVDGDVGLPCNDRGVHLTRQRSGAMGVCWTFKPSGGLDFIRCGSSQPTWAVIDLDPLDTGDPGDAFDDHVSFDTLSAFPPFERFVATHNKDGGADHIAMHFPDATDPSFRFPQGSGGDYPYAMLQTDIAAAHVTWHASSGGESWMVHAMCDLSTGCDAAGEWAERLVVPATEDADFQQLEIATDDRFQVLAFEANDLDDGLQRKVFLRSRCAPATFPATVGDWDPMDAPIVAREPPPGAAQFLDRGRPFVVLNPIENLVHVVFREQKDAVNPASETDIWWATFAYDDCS